MQKYNNRHQVEIVSGTEYGAWQLVQEESATREASAECRWKITADQV